MSKSNELLTPSEAAAILMVSPVTLRQWAQKGKIPFHVTPGGHRRFHIKELKAFTNLSGSTSNTAEHALKEENSSIISVLIVDDNVELCHFIQAMLKQVRPEWNIILAHDGFEAGIKIQQSKPTVMLVDFNLPGLNGAELCRNIKSIEELKKIRIIGMSGNVTAENKHGLLAAGAEVVLQKPITQDKIIDSIEINQT